MENCKKISGSIWEFLKVAVCKVSTSWWSYYTQDLLRWDSQIFLRKVNDVATRGRPWVYSYLFQFLPQAAWSLCSTRVNTVVLVEHIPINISGHPILCNGYFCHIYLSLLFRDQDIFPWVYKIPNFTLRRTAFGNWTRNCRPRRIYCCIVLYLNILSSLCMCFTIFCYVIIIVYHCFG